MIQNYSYPPDFKELIKKIQNKYKDFDLLEHDGIGQQLDVNLFSKKFFGTITNNADISVDANANIEDKGIVQYVNELSKPLNRLNGCFLLWKYSRHFYDTKFADMIVEKHLTKEIYINDFSTYVYMFYCFNYSCMDVVLFGLPYVTKLPSEPPKNLSSYVGQIIQFATYAGNSQAGATGLADFLICFSWFVDKLYKENILIPKDYLNKQIKQEMQSFIFSVNQPFRGGAQSLFINVSIYDSVFLTKLCSEYVFPDGTNPNPVTIQYLQNLFVDIMNDTLTKAPVTFPVTTACFSVDENRKIQDEEFLNFISEKNKKFGFINIYAGKTSTLSSCCRLRSDTEIEFQNSFGSGGTKIGSLGVCTINLPRLAFNSKNTEDFLSRVTESVEICSKVNQVKRHIIKKRIENNQYPLYTFNFVNLKKQYSTCGLIGLYEAIEILGMNICEENGLLFCEKLLNIINKINDIQTLKYKYPHNTEQIPGENVAVVTAEADRLLGFNKKYKLYSNQFIPLTVDVDIIERIRIQGRLDKHMSGGSILHINITDQITDIEFMKKLIRFTIESGVVYHAINYNLQSCKNKHISVGKNEICPECGEKNILNHTRVVGFLTTTKNWGKIRREIDYPNRTWIESKNIHV